MKYFIPQSFIEKAEKGIIGRPGILLSIYLLLSITVIAQDKSRMIAEERYISINGIEQWVTIHGDSSKPAILFIHGGPGSPISPYSEALFKEWEKDFVIVHWDQRGTGRTYGRQAPEEMTPDYLRSNPLTVSQMTNDGIAVSEYLLKRLGKRKVILFGTSWGSFLGVMMATQKPDLYAAYIGHSQIVRTVIDTTLYHTVYDMAEKAIDTTSLKILISIGKPPYEKARSVGQLMRVVKKYERAHSAPAPDAWFTEAPAYSNPKDNQHREEGDDYSFVYFVGDKAMGISSMVANINLLKDKLSFDVPVYFIQGNEDLLTPKENSRKYFDAITAPTKKYFLLPRAAHGFNEAVLESLYKICKGIQIN